MLKQDHNTEKRIRYFRDLAIDRASSLQSWENYYRLRAKEMELLLSFHDMKKAGRILEIGCGNGFSSAMLSPFATQVVATDLSRTDAKTHTVGISKAGRLFRDLGIANCVALSCSGDRLPFKDGSFDIVFCLHTLEHIADRPLMLKEARRVISDGGEAVFVMPSLMSRVVYPFSYYPDLIKRSISVIFKRYRASEARSTCGDMPAYGQEAGRIKSQWRKFREHYPHFPIPEPHGAFKGYFIEMMSCRMSVWTRLFNEAGFRVVKKFSTSLIPRCLVGLFTEPLAFYEKHSWFDREFGSRRGFRSIGQNVCIVAEK